MPRRNPKGKIGFSQSRTLAKESRIACTGCGLCSCQYGIAIRDNFIIYNANHIFDVPFISDKTYSLQIANTGMQADLCNDCGRCDGVCPQGLNIPCELRKTARYFANTRFQNENIHKINISLHFRRPHFPVRLSWERRRARQAAARTNCGGMTAAWALNEKRYFHSMHNLKGACSAAEG